MILEAFNKMKDNQIGGLPVTEGATRKIFGNISIRDIRFLLLKPELFTNFRYNVIYSCIVITGIYADING